MGERGAVESALRAIHLSVTYCAALVLLGDYRRGGELGQQPTDQLPELVRAEGLEPVRDYR
jgi:hypothetical protein